MYLDFQDGHPDYDRVPSALSTREGVFLSIIVHLLAIILILVMPQLPFFKARAAAARAAAEAARRAMIERQKEPNRTFVFVQPRVELEPLRPPPPRAPLSDRDRTALSKERAPNPVNRQPFHRGNTPEFVEPSPPPRASRSPGATQPAPQTPPAESQNASRTPGNENAFQFPDAGNRPPARSGAGPPPGQTPGPLGEAIRNLSRYTEQGAFENPNGGDINQFGPLQFDTKGVEFGPWVRRFVAQVKRNWFPPQAAMALRGHVVITFNVHKSGALTDLTVIGPSSVDSFNNSALNALATSNPTYPLPPEYPSDKAFFTVTFYYNEMPPQGP
jgi:TonB family protein